MSILGVSLSLAALAAIGAGFYLGGFRGASIVAGLLMALWIAERINASFDAEAEVKRLTASAQKTEEAFRKFKAASDRAARAAANKIIELRVASAVAEGELASVRQRAAEDIQTLKERIASHVPARPQCDYDQPVLDGLRDAWRAADGRSERPGAR